MSIDEKENVINPSIEELQRATKLMEFLGIPTHNNDWGYWSEIDAIDLYHILIDEEKLQVLISKLKLKAFW